MGYKILYKLHISSNGTPHPMMGVSRGVTGQSAWPLINRKAGMVYNDDPGVQDDEEELDLPFVRYGDETEVLQQVRDSHRQLVQQENQVKVDNPMSEQKEEPKLDEKKKRQMRYFGREGH